MILLLNTVVNIFLDYYGNETTEYKGKLLDVITLEKEIKCELIVVQPD